MVLSLWQQYSFCFVFMQTRQAALQRSKGHDGMSSEMPLGPFFGLRGVPQIPWPMKLGRRKRFAVSG